jgi:rhodanese-related sulfurtransferase
MSGLPSRCRWLLLLGGGLLVTSCLRPESPPPVPSTSAKPAPPAGPTVKQGAITAISLDVFVPLQQSGDVLVYDVRPAIFYHLGHIPGAINWPKGKFDSGLAVHEPELAAAAKAGRPVVLYCTDRECPDAGAVARRLSARGHAIALLEGGYADWKAADMPTE